MLVEPGERLFELSDGIVIAPLPGQLFGVALLRRDVARHPGFVFIPPQVGGRVHRFLDSACRPLGGPTAKHVGQQLNHNVRNRSGNRQECQHPDPDLIAARLDHVNDQNDLDQNG